MCVCVCVCVCVYEKHSWAEHRSVESLSRLRPSNIFPLNLGSDWNHVWTANILFLLSLSLPLSQLFLSLSASLDSSLPLISSLHTCLLKCIFVSSSFIFSFFLSPSLNTHFESFPLFVYSSSILCLLYDPPFPFFLLFLFFSLIALFFFFFFFFFPLHFFSLPLFECFDWLSEAGTAVGPTQAHTQPLISISDDMNSNVYTATVCLESNQQWTLCFMLGGGEGVFPSLHRPSLLMSFTH